MANEEMQQKIQNLRDKLDLQKQQVTVLNDLWLTLFTDEVYQIEAGQFMIWLRKYEFDHIVSAFESGADWLSTERQKIEEGAEGALESAPGKFSLIRIVSKNMVKRREIEQLKAKRGHHG